MRRIEKLYNEAVELNKEYKNKIETVFDCTKWPTESLICCIQAELECSDNVAVASRAFWHSDAIEKELKETDKKELFNKAYMSCARLAYYRRKFNKLKVSEYLSEYHFNYNMICKDIQYYINEMKKYYENYLKYSDLDGDSEAEFAFADIETLYNEYKIRTKELSMVTKSKLFKDISNLQEKQFTGDKEIDKILDTLYNFDFSELNRSWQIGKGWSDHVILVIRDMVYDRLSNIEPELDIKYYDSITFDSTEEKSNFYTIINYIIDTYTRKQRDTEDSNNEFRLKYGSLVKLMLNKIDELKHSKNKISTSEYENRYFKLRKELSIM